MKMMEENTARSLQPKNENGVAARHLHSTTELFAQHKRRTQLRHAKTYPFPKFRPDWMELSFGKWNGKIDSE